MNNQQAEITALKHKAESFHTAINRLTTRVENLETDHRNSLQGEINLDKRVTALEENQPQLRIRETDPVNANKFEPGHDGCIGDLIEYGTDPNIQGESAFLTLDENEATLWVSTPENSVQIDLTYANVCELIGAGLAILEHMEKPTNE